jgi:starch synthase
MAIEVWMASAELSPLARTGGLGEVVRSLPNALASTGARVRRFIPGYGCVDRTRFGPAVEGFNIPVGKIHLPVAFRSRTDTGGVITTLVENEELFGRKEIYGPPGGEFPDNPRRFAFFCRAIAELARRSANPPDVVHAHDWPAALTSLFIKLIPSWNDPQPATVFSIHNLAYQGRYGSWHLPWLGLSESELSVVFQPAGIEYCGDFSFLKAGLVYSDRLVTVSPTYAREILTPEHGNGLEGVLRERVSALTGILNGVDDEVWNCSTDPFLSETYDARTVEKGKRAAREIVRKEFALETAQRPLLAIVGRFAYQKGVDVLLAAAPSILDDGVDLVVVGEGDPKMAAEMQELANRHPGRAGVFIGYDDRMAHLAMAAADLVAVPSRYEPCGLAQMYAQKYGAVPVVHRTGGLADTVIDANASPKDGTGFVFSPLNEGELRKTVGRAMAIFRNEPKRWAEIRQRGMKKSFSWLDAARAYIEVYRSVGTPPCRQPN